MCGTWTGIALPCMLQPLLRPMQQKWLVFSSFNFDVLSKTCNRQATKNKDKHISETIEQEYKTERVVNDLF